MRKIVLIIIILFPVILLSQNVFVQFEVENRDESFSKNAKIQLSINGEKVTPLFFANGFVIPPFNGAKSVDVYFEYKRSKCCFTNVPVEAFSDEWVLGYDKRPFLKRTKELTTTKARKKVFYLRFIPNDGDGVQRIISQ